MHIVVLIVVIAAILWLMQRQKPPEGARRSPCPPLGDLDGDGWITKEDIKLMMSPGIWMKTVDPTSPNYEQLLIADVDGSGHIDIGDTGHMKAYLAGTIDTFPACSV